MPPSEYSSQLHYLKKSADLLVSQSPSTSAHLLAVHNRILHEDFKSLNRRQCETSCGACGSIRKPEWTKTIQVQRRRKKAKRSDQATSASSTSKSKDDAATTVFKCLRCHRRTVINPRRQEAVRTNASSRTIPASDIQQPASMTDSSVNEREAPQSASETVEASKSADNASSKKRAKTRKQNGLQALLAAKQRSQAEASSSLELFDFLQQ